MKHVLMINDDTQVNVAKKWMQGHMQQSPLKI